MLTHRIPVAKRLFQELASAGRSRPAMRNWFLALLVAPCWGQTPVLEVTREGEYCRVNALNRTRRALTVSLPEGSVLTHPEGQDWLLLEGREFKLPPGGKFQGQMKALAVGRRGEKGEGSGYGVLSPGQHPGAQRLLKLKTCAEKLLREGEFPPLPVPPVWVVSQWAFWKEQGSDKAELLGVVRSQLQPGPSGESELLRGVDYLWEAVELTSSEAGKP